MLQQSAASRYRDLHIRLGSHGWFDDKCHVVPSLKQIESDLWRLYTAAIVEVLGYLALPTAG
jgi:hypothetical protein